LSKKVSQGYCKREPVVRKKKRKSTPQQKREDISYRFCHKRGGKDISPLSYTIRGKIKIKKD